MIYWNPNPVAFTIPFVNIPILIYGVCFTAGFVVGYLIMLHLVQKTLPSFSRKEVQKLVDQLTWFVIGGTIIGARLGHVFFYDWDRYRENPLLILNTREGGLASHGGTIGVLLALGIYYVYFFRKKTGLNFLQLLDLIVIPTAFVAFMIRIGNFFNQEIIGIPTDLPWGIIFGSPADHSAAVARHPAQLYEAFAYLAIFGLLLTLWKTTNISLRVGRCAGLFFTLIFGTRFLIEYVKAPMDSIFDQSLLQAGQWLSIPFILGGLLLILYSKKFYKKTA